MGMLTKTGRKGRKGFTIIELLVVIAIISILAAILLPVFGRVKERARGTQCIMNLKQSAVAFMMYASDNDDMLPFAWQTDPHAVTNRWAPAILPYMGGDEALRCPNGGEWPGSQYGDYGMPYWLSNVRLGSITYPTARFLLGDAGTYTVHFANNCEPVNILRILGPNWRGWTAPGGFGFFNFRPRHNEKINMAFADGHASSLPLSACAVEGSYDVIDDNLDYHIYPTYYNWF